jgi:hypothetical protein
MNWLAKTRGAAAVSGTLASCVKKALPVALCGLLVATVAQTIPACSSATPADATSGKGPQPGSGTDGGGTTDACDHPSPGCACSQAGDVANCGKVLLRSGDFFQCEEGTTTCDGSKWGACDGDITVTGQAISGGGFSLQSLGRSMTCGAVNPCDPYCYVQIDTAPGLDGGPGLTVLDGGLQVAIPPGLNTCSEATTPATVYSTAAVGAFAANPASCTAGASDNCNFDYTCATTGGTCAPYGDGTSKVVGNCATQPDFTAGLGCWDTSATSGLELNVCNRGGVTAGLGNLVVAIESGAPAPALAAGTCPAGSKVATGPALPTTGTTTGKCTINLATDPIGAGECLSFNVASPPTNITCTASGGGTITPTAAQMFAVVNPPASIATGYTPLTECDACNNFTAINNSSLPAGSPPMGAGACTKTWCGFQAGSTGGSTCQANIVGTVMDPGLNVGLSNVAVYIATGTPITFADEPANATAGTVPVCDSCASLSSPGYMGGVATRTDGTFTLPVAPGVYTVIAQIGRWRRIVTNVSAPACTNTTIPTSSISLPQNRTQGDIPKMAIVEGSQESLECWLAKVGLSSSEFAPYSAGAAQRIQTFVSENDASGQDIQGVAPPSASVLWDNGASSVINDYSAVLVACDGETDKTISNAAQTEVVNYANAGGRVFLDHLPAQTFVQNATGSTPTIPLSGWATSAIANWQGNATPTSVPAQGEVINGTSAVDPGDQVLMHNWLAMWDVAPYTTNPFGAGFIQSAVPRSDALSLGADSLELVRGDNNNCWASNTTGCMTNNPNPFELSFWFNTPITQTPGNYCGRVVYNDMHVSNGRGGTSSGSSFPTSCVTTALTSEELALEYEMFQLSACNLGTSIPIPPPPPPPPPVPLMSTTFTRTFQAACSPGFTVRWGFFEWQATIPAGTSIGFTAQTAPDLASGQAGTYGTAVNVANATTSSTSMYATSMNSVDTDLTSAGQSSQDWLEVHMTLNPTATVSPILTNWQQLYDCVP